VKNVVACGRVNATAAEKKNRFTGHADVVLKFARIACMKISGACLATGLPGNALIAGLKTGMEISRWISFFLCCGGE
jgi:hypothetical protein